MLKRVLQVKKERTLITGKQERITLIGEDGRKFLTFLENTIKRMKTQPRMEENICKSHNLIWD